jgi:deazaflavin-dependent oxidoreductase (nitroreductase family)
MAAEGTVAPMPLPHVVARANKRITNRFIEPIARRASGFAVVHHIGRRSGIGYSTPVNVFDLHGRPLVVLTYGERADWLQNLRAAPGRLERADRVVAIAHVDVVDRQEAWPALPRFVRLVLRLLRVQDFALLHIGDEFADEP